MVSKKWLGADRCDTDMSAVDDPELRDAIRTAADALAQALELVPAPRAPVTERVPMTFRITKAAYERLRQRAFETRVSQQALMDQALDQFLGIT